LWNVLLGQIVTGWSRIIHPSELRYGHFAQNALCQPGITGLWQISGRQHNFTPNELASDMHYIDTRSLAGDSNIPFKTLMS